MALFKILKGPEKKDDLGVSVMLDPNKSGLKINEGWAYVTEEGNFYVDFSQDTRLHINAHSITSDFATSDKNGYEIAKTYISKIEYVKNEDDIKGSSSNPYLRYHFGPQTGLAPAHVAMPAANASNGGIITTGTQIITGDKTINDGGSLTITKLSGFNFSGIEKGKSDATGVVWFAHSSKKGTPVYNENFLYNPLAKTWSIKSVPNAGGILYVSRLQGLAYAAEKDASNQTISSTYISNIALSNNKNAPTYNVTKGDSTGFVVQFPVANASNNDSTTWTAGIVTNTDQTFGGNKTFKDTISISKNTEATSTTSGVLKVAGGAGIAKSLYVGKNLNVAENVDVGKNLSVVGQLEVDDSATFNDSVNLKSALTVDGITQFLNEVNISNKLTVSQKTTLSGGLAVEEGISTDTLTTASDVGIGGALTVVKLSTLQGGLTVAKDKATSLGGSLSVDGNTTLNKELTVKGQAIFKDNITLDNTKKTLYIKGQLKVDNAVSFESSLYVNGTSQFHDKVTMDGALEVGTTTTLNNTLSVSGATTLKDTLTVEKAATLKNNLSITGVTKTTGGHYVHDASGTSVTAGYVNVATIKISGSYQNVPLIFEIADRGRKESSTLYIQFANVDSSDPDLYNFTYTGPDHECWLYKASTSTWHLYVKKSENYGNINILRYEKAAYNSSIAVSWTNVGATAVPSGSIRATIGGQVKYAVNANVATYDTSNQPITSYIKEFTYNKGTGKNAATNPTYAFTRGDATSGVITIPVANASDSNDNNWTAGIVTNTNQTFGGNKTFKGSVSISNTTASTSSTTGALKVSGGVGVAGNIYSGGSINAKQGAFSGNVDIGGNLTVANKDKATTLNGTLSVGQGASIANGLVVSSGTITLSGETSIGANLNVGGIVNISAETDSSATNKGALIVAGGAGIGKALYVGGMSNLQGGLTVGTSGSKKATILYGTLTAHGKVQINESLTVGTTASNKNTTLNGDLTVSGTTTLKGATTAENTLTVKNTFTVGISGSTTATILNGSLDVSGIASFNNTVSAPSFKGPLTGNVTGNVSGNAGTATKLATARTISLTGAVTGSGTFDGSGNLSIATTSKTITWDSITGKPSSFTASAHNHDSLYLKLSGGTLTGTVSMNANTQLKNADTGSSWILGRDNAGLRMTTSTSDSSFSPAFSSKTQLGSWDVGPCHPMENFYFSYATDTNYNAGTNSTISSIYFSKEGYIHSGRTYGAVWNDYAEYRSQSEDIEPGYCVASSNNGKISKTSYKYQSCDGIVSDTFGFAIGETEDCQTPLAVSGRVLAYCEGDRYDYQAGDTVCAGPNGKVVKMTRKEIQEWPDRIVGTVSEIPEYDTWGSGNVKVNGRIWIKVR